jgi:hypothetical protein
MPPPFLSNGKGARVAIRMSKVALAGLVAGLVGNVIGFVGFGLLLGPRLQAEAVAIAPALAGRAGSGLGIAFNVVQFVIGGLIVWLYAAMQPRFGATMRTAACAGLVVWVCGLLFHADWLVIGMMSPLSYTLASALALVQVLAVASIGAKVYGQG